MYDIKYSIIKFEIEFLKNSKLNINKHSAIRGIIGNTLINENCLVDNHDRICNECILKNKCLAYNIFSPKIISISNNLEENISPFIIICDDKREFISNKDKLTFAMIFFGDTISYIPEIIRVVKIAGESLGLDNNLFKLKRVINDKNEDIYFEGISNYRRVNVRTIKEYIENRLRISKDVSRIEIISPIRFKKNKRFNDDLVEQDIVNLVKRRLTTLAALEDRVITIDEKFDFKIKYKDLKWSEYNRYSNRQKSRMSLGGIVGYLDLEDVSEETKKLLIAGELIHIGKSTSFGLGDYILY